MAYHQKIVTDPGIPGVVDITSVETLTAPEWAEWVRDHLHPDVSRDFLLPWVGPSYEIPHSVFNAVIPRMQAEPQRVSYVGLAQCLDDAYTHNSNSSRGSGENWIDGEEPLSELFLLVNGLKHKVSSARSYFGNDMLLRFLDVLEARPRFEQTDRQDHDSYERCLQVLDPQYLDVPFWSRQLDLSEGIYLRTVLPQVLRRESAVDDFARLLQQEQTDLRILEMVASSLFTVESSIIDSLESRAASLPVHVRDALLHGIGENRRLRALPRG